jgi:predicted nucleic acid-binding protein
MSREAEVVALDGGVLIALAVGEELSGSIKDRIIRNEVRAVTHELALTEMAYMLCRNLGWDLASTKLEYLTSSGLVSIDETSELIKDAAMIKCERALALPDCFTLASAKRHRCKALFVRMEEELRKEISSRSLGVDVAFLIN